MTRLTEQETKSAHSSTKGTNFIGDFKINRLRILHLNEIVDHLLNLVMVKVHHGLN